MKNDFEKAIANLKEGEIILGARVAKDGTKIVINEKVNDTIHGTVLVMLLHAVYATAIKEAQKHDVPMELAKMLAELPIMMAFKAFKEVKDDKEMMNDIMGQIGEQKEHGKGKCEDDAPNEEEQLQKRKEELNKDIDEVCTNLAPNEKKLFIELIASMAMRAAEKEAEK